MVAQVPVCFDIAEQGYWLDAQLGRECRNGSVSVGLGSLGQADLSLCQCELAPAFSTACTSCGKASHGPFPDQVALGSRLIDPQSQNMTVAARATADRIVLAHLS
jgi:hypothetical protein